MLTTETLLLVGQALLEEFGLSRAQQRRVVVARPAMLGLSTEATRGALLSLRRELRLAEAELPNLVAGQPGVLWGREERLASWSEMLSTVLATTRARLVPPGAPAAPTSLRAQPEHLGSLRWPQELASGRPKADGFPVSSSRLAELRERFALSPAQLRQVRRRRRPRRPRRHLLHLHRPRHRPDAISP